MAMLWTLAYSDGEHSTLDIAEVSSSPSPPSMTRQES